MALEDSKDVIYTLDAWLSTGLADARVAECFREQGWDWHRRNELRDHPWALEAWARRGELLPLRGVGWRVWYPDGTILTQKDCGWPSLPNGIVLGIVYEGRTRRIIQGMDPYYLDPQTAMPHDNRWYTLPWGLDPVLCKMGVWVTDEEMSAYRWQAALAMTMKESQEEE
jgi:hypothetical protein